MEASQLQVADAAVTEAAAITAMAQGLEAEATLEAEAQSMEEQDAMDGEAEDMRANDPACLFCDDGGNIMSCDGNCMRSYHIGMKDTDTEELYSDIQPCNPMQMPEDLAARLDGSKDPFLCPSCLSSRHHCFKCHREGSSDPSLPLTSSSVKRCAVFECGRFYHPRCIGKDIKEVAFTCPLHVCEAARGGKCGNEDPDEPLIECRRCPVAYHEDCIPLALMATRSSQYGKRVWLAKPTGKRKPAGKSDEESDEEEPQGDPVDRSLIYCQNHPFQPYEDNPAHEQPLFSPALLSSWKLHYSKTFPDLESSKKLLAERQQADREKQAKLRSIASPSQSSAKKTEGKLTKLAFQELRLEDSAMPPPVKRRRLVRLKDADDGKAREEEIMSADDLVAAQRLPGQSAKDNLTPLQESNADIPLEQTYSEEIGADNDSDSEGSIFSFEQEAYWTNDNIAARHAKMMEQAKQKFTLDMIKRKTRMPEPYAQPFKKTINQERLQGILQAFKLAKENPEQKNLYITKNVVAEVYQHEDNMRTSLACYLHNDRYSSYGRHFTKVDLLKLVAKKLEVFINPDDTIVDFSCGSNEFLPIVKKVCREAGKCVKGKAFDIITPCISEDFQQKSWFDVQPEDLDARGENLVIGLNPPYGMNNALAAKFQDQAAKFRPRLLVLIVPPTTPIPFGYVVLLEDRMTMADKSFYIPGLPEAKQDQWNKVTPSFRIMAHKEWYPLSDRLHAEHMGPIALAYRFPTIPRVPVAPPQMFFGPPPVMPIMPMGQQPALPIRQWSMH